MHAEKMSDAARAALTIAGIVTTQLNNGLSVAAQVHRKYGLTALTYVNRKQADARCFRIKAAGIPCYVAQLGPCFYVVI